MFSIKTTGYEYFTATKNISVMFNLLIFNELFFMIRGWQSLVI